MNQESSLAEKEVHMTDKTLTTVSSSAGTHEDQNVSAQSGVPPEDAEKKTLLETIRMGCDVIGEAHVAAGWFQSPDTEFYLKLALDNANEALKAFRRDFVTAGKKKEPTIGHIKLPPIKRRKSRNTVIPKSQQVDGGAL
jgi:hypothetical protein